MQIPLKDFIVDSITSRLGYCVSRLRISYTNSHDRCNYKDRISQDCKVGCSVKTLFQQKNKAGRKKAE